MATEYHLLTWLGKTPATVTFTDVGDVVNHPTHNARTSMALQFPDNAGNALPIGLSKNTTYYLREGVDTGKYTIHTTKDNAIGNTGQVAFTGTGTGTHKVIGAYWATLDVEGRATYGAAGSERVWATLAAFASATPTNYTKDVIIHLSNQYIDASGYFDPPIYHSFVITSKINGVRTEAFHFGAIGSGFEFKSTGNGIRTNTFGTEINGFTITSTGSSSNATILPIATGTILENNIISATGTGGIGIKDYGVGHKFSNNLIHSCPGTGIILFNGSGPYYLYNNTVVGCGTGINGNSTGQVFAIGNICVGNTINWGTAPSSGYFNNNAGLVTDPVWGVTHFHITTDSDATTGFKNYVVPVTTASDFSPPGNSITHTSSSVLVDSGNQDFSDIPVYDLKDNPRPSYKNGSATNWDIGAYEFDWGYGLAPLTVPITISNIISGSVLAIYKTSDGSVILAPTTVGGTAYSNPSFSYAGDTAVTIVITNAAYVRYLVPNNITTAGMSQIAGQEADTVRLGSYPAGIATEWTITDGVSFEHTSGSTIYTGQQLYSRLCDYFDQSSRHLVPLVMSAETHFDFTLKAPYTITDASHQWIKTCSITEASGATLWSNAKLVTTGLASGTDIYAIQNGSKITSWWATGTLDILIKVKTGGTLIDSGLVKFFVREYGKLYAHYLADLSGGGSNPIPLSTDVDSNNATTIGTIAALSGISLTVGATTWDVGDGAGAQPYTATLNCNNHTLADVYEYCKWLTRRTSTTSINGVQGEQYTHLASFPDVVSAPLGTFAGGKFFPAIGIKLTNINAADVLHFQAMDNNGVTHASPVPPVSLTITNMVVGSRLQLYDLTASTELFNDIVAASSQSVTYTYPGSDHDIRYRVAYVNGVTAKSWVEDQGVATSTGMNIRVNQQPDAVYNAIAVDGSTVTECSISGDTLVININDPDNTTTAQRLYSFECYWLTTAGGIRDQNLYIQATDITHYVYEGGLKIKNSKANPLQITGANIVPVSGPATDVFDNTGGSIFLNFNRVEGFSYSIGSGLSTAEHNQLMALYPGLTTAQETKLNSKLSTGTFIALT